jgi:Gpi18-like mannosyltransferase
MPDTSTFLVYGYIVILGILAAYILSLAIKGKKILKKLDQIQSKK